MIGGNWGLTFNILSIVFVGLYSSLCLISLVVYLASNQLNRFTAKVRLRLLWCVGILPWFVSFICVGLQILPELTPIGETWFSFFVHWHHIYNFEILSWHGASLFIFSMVFISVCLTRLLKAIKANKQLDQLDFFVKTSCSERGLTIIESRQHQAFTSGLFRPRSYITSGLRDQLTRQEMLVVSQHELAHAKTRDPLRKFSFSLFAAFFPKFIAQQLNDRFALALEQIADESVLLTGNDETVISKTMLKVSSLRSQFSGVTMSPSNCHFSAHPLSLRIQYLLRDNKGQPFPFALFFSFAITLTLLSTLSVDLLHHALEKLFHHQ